MVTNGLTSIHNNSSNYKVCITNYAYGDGAVLEKITKTKN